MASSLDDFEFAAPAAASGGLDDFEMPSAPGEPVKKPAVSTVKDMAKGFGSGIAAGFESIPGWLGSGVKAGEELGDRARTLYENTRDPRGRTPEQVDAEVRAQRVAKRAARGEDENWAHVGPMWLPTAKQVLESNPESVSNFKPETKAGEKSKALGSAIPGLAGGVASLPVSGATKGLGFAGTTLGTAAGEAVKDEVPASWLGWKRAGVTPDEMRGVIPMLGGTLGGAAFTATVAGIPTADKMRAQGLGAAREADQRLAATNPARGPLMTPQEAAQARALGVEVPDHLMMGRNERGAVAQAAGDHVPSRAKVESLNDEIASGRVAPFDRVHGFIDDSFGGNGVNMQEQIPRLQAIVKQTNDANYAHVMDNLPHAQDVWSPALQKLYSDPTMRPYIQKALEVSERKGDAIRPPVWRDEVPAEPARVIIGQGNNWQRIGETPGVPAGFYPDPAAPVNLRFHDTVKRLMDPDINDLYRAGRSAEADSLKAQRDRLLGETDRLVPEYPQHARDPAHEVFGDRDSLQAGYQFHRKLDDYGVAKVRQAMGRMSDEQVGLFQYGLAGAIKADLQQNPATAMKKIVANRSKYDSVFGPEWVERLLWEHKTAAAQARAQGIELPPHAPPVGWMQRAAGLAGHVAKSPLGAPVAGLGVDAALDMLPTVTGMLPHGVGAAVGTALAPVMAVRSIRKGVRNSRQRRANEAIIDDVTNGAGRELPPARLPDYSNAPLLGGVTRKAGGEVGPPPRGKADVSKMAGQLVRAVDAARAELSGETQNILAQPDAHVVQALSVASKALG